MRSSIVPFSTLNFLPTSSSGVTNVVDHIHATLSIPAAPEPIDFFIRGP
jgi:hypothetical protein